MCAGIIHLNKKVYNQYELKKLIGKKSIVFHEGSHYDGNACLCPVDYRKTAEKIGCTSERPDGGLDIFFIPKVPNEQMHSL